MADDPEDKRRDNAIMGLAFWTVLILVTVCLIGIQQYLLAAVLTAFATYRAAIHLVPAKVSKLCTFFENRSHFKEVEGVARAGIAYCKALRIETIGSLPRSIAWDAILTSQLSNSLIQQGRFAEALKTNEAILVVLEEAQDVTGAAKVSEMMPFCYVAMGNLNKAEELLQRTVPRLEAAVHNAATSNQRFLPLYRTLLCNALFEQATLLEKRRRFVESEPVRRKALALSIKVFGADNLNVMPHLSMLGKLMTQLERFDEAESNLDKVLAVRLKHYPRDHILVGSAKQGLGNIYCKTDRLDLADTYLSEALSNLEKIGGENPDLPEYKADLARLKVKQGKFRDAKQLVLSAINQKERQGSDTHTDLIEYLEVLSELKRATGAIDEAEATEIRLAAIRATIK